MNTEEKVYGNAVIADRLFKLAPAERQEVIKKLTAGGKSQRQVARELGVPYSTVHDWHSGRQNNKGKDIHVSLAAMVRKLKEMNPEEITDWGRIEQILETCQDLIARKPVKKDDKDTN